MQMLQHHPTHYLLYSDLLTKKSCSHKSTNLLVSAFKLSTDEQTYTNKHMVSCTSTSPL